MKYQFSFDTTRFNSYLSHDFNNIYDLLYFRKNKVMC